MSILTVEIAASELAVVPGEQAVAEVTVRNAGPADERVRVLAGVRGRTADWLTVEPSPLTVPGHGAASAVVRARPPAVAGPPAGAVPYEVEARCERDHAQWATATGTVVVTAVHDVVAVLSPGTAQIRGRGRCRVDVENRGNVQEDISLVVRPRSGELGEVEIEAPPAFHLAPGRHNTASVLLRTPRRWFGPEQTAALVVEVRTGAETASTLHVTAVSRPLFPRQRG